MSTETPEEYSGRFVVRIPKSLHASLVKESRAEGTSLNQLVLSKLSVPLSRALADWEIRSCRVCGCTDDDCRQCIERTGEPCTWVEDDLCSACVDPLEAPCPGS